MNVQHKDLAGGRWGKMSFCEQMAHIGSEVSRALHWRRKGKEDLSRKSLYRALELIDLSTLSIKKYPRLKELRRVRESLVDFFCGKNDHASSEISWEKYFNHFNCLARKNR